MPASSGQSQFSIRSLVALKLKLKNYVCGQSPIDFENILEETYLPISISSGVWWTARDRTTAEGAAICV